MIYSDDMIQKSREELYAFIKFYNQKIGYEPIIIGGWAVDYYNTYYGSKDIDVVFTAKQKRYDQSLKHYFKAHGHELVPKDLLGLVKTYRKVCTGADGEQYYIDIDACNIEDKNTFHTNPDKEIPYSLVTKHYVKVKTDDMAYKIPSIELLLGYKLKAYADRNYDLSQSTELKDIENYTSKRDKDGSDIIALLDKQKCKARIELGKFNEMITKYDIKTELHEALQDISQNPSSHNNYKRLDEKTIKNLIKNVQKS